ncbi:uncharacterized protein [Amphiura filiformis]|uniref:uncharacterized protein n=1 Tax=Amphiura filiformis TaxID=82378 RepID=UPI003B226DB9
MAGNSNKNFATIIVMFLAQYLQIQEQSRRVRQARVRRVLRQAQNTIVFAHRRCRQTRMMMIVAMAILYSSTRIVDPDARMPQYHDWWEECALPHYTDTQWMKNFRMKRDTFFRLVDEIEPEMIPRLETNAKKPISLPKRVAITIWRLATPCEYRTIGLLFGVGRSTANKIVHEVCAAIMLTIYQDYIRWPSGDRLKTVLRGFEIHRGYPQCAGAIDGTHIQISAPLDQHNDYHNRKGFTSIILQAVCDHQLRFTDVYVGWAGRAHDARVLRNSTLYQRGADGTLFPLWTKNIEGCDVPVHIIGDPAYPLLQWLMKGYPDNNNLTRQHKRFNFRLSSARMVIEMSFGQLKGRWRCIGVRNDSDLEFVPIIVAACCALHNFCIDHDDPFHRKHLDLPANFDVFEEPTYHQVDVNDAVDQQIVRNLPDAKTIRTALTQHFWNN